MTDKTIENRRKVGSYCFLLIKSRMADKKLDFYLERFNINDYWIYKLTKQQYEVTIEDLYDFKYSGYILFKKDKYDNKIIDKSIELINKKFGGLQTGLMYLNKPLPPLEIIEKIKVL